MRLYNADCLQAMSDMEENSVDSIVTDPPYGLSFMGKNWDHGVPGEEFWKAALRVAKPGAHLLAFGGTRTFHRLAVAIEDAGWEIRDTVMWVYGSGFPKSHNVSKAIDKAAGAEREVIGSVRTKDIRRNVASDIADGKTDRQGKFAPGSPSKMIEHNITAPATEAAKQWDGWGTALKPAWEPIILARKPLSEKTIAKNVLKWGTGAMNIDGCRVGTEENLGRPQGTMPQPMDWGNKSGKELFVTEGNPKGRWPANLIHDGSDEVVRLFPDTKSGKPGTMRKGENAGAAYGAESRKPGTPMTGFGDKGSAARFFYCAKASKADRDDGLEDMEEKDKRGPMTDSNWSGNERFDGQPLPKARNNHPTVKPTSLMQFLCRLITPPQGTVFDPFMGSGSTGKAAKIEGFDFAGCEISEEYYQIAKARIESAKMDETQTLFDSDCMEKPDDE